MRAGAGISAPALARDAVGSVHSDHTDLSTDKWACTMSPGHCLERGTVAVRSAAKLLGDLVPENSGWICGLGGAARGRSGRLWQAFRGLRSSMTGSGDRPPKTKRVC